MEEVVAAQVQVVDQIGPPAGPETSATATARLRATTGVGCEGGEVVVELKDLRQSVSAAVAASPWTALIAAWSW